MVSEYKWANGPSIDEVIAARIGSGTRYRSLQFATYLNTLPQVGTVISYAGANQPLVAMNWPNQAFQRLYGTEAGLTPAQIAQRKAKRKSVLDHVGGEIASLNNTLGADAKRKLDAHLTTIRELERRTAASVYGNRPPAPRRLDYATVPLNSNSTSDHAPNVNRDHIDLMVSAMVSDLTRVASLACGSGGVSWVFKWLQNPSEDHHSLSHNFGDAAAVRQFNKESQWQAGEVSYLISSLKATPDLAANNGSSLFDNTLVYWFTEMSQDHSFFSVPYVLAAGRNIGLRTGRYLKFGSTYRTQPDGFPSWRSSNGTSVNDLLVSLCQTMGLTDVQRFGHADFCKGPLTL